jgi:peptide/nickel transport system permease protein
MLRMLVHRALVGLAVVVGVVTLTFILLHAAPGDPAERLLGPMATAEQLAAGRRALGLDRPLPVQFLAWLDQAARGDWGTSLATGRPVRGMLGAAWPATVRLVLLSLLLSYGLGFLIGAIQAARSRSRLDTTLSVVSVTLVAMPGYWLGLMLIMLFTYALRVLPAFGAAGLDADYLGGWARFADSVRHLVLPLATLTVIGVGGAARFIRGAMLDALAQPFIAAARAKGVSPSRLLLHHTVRHALIPVITLLGLSLPALFSGAVFVESVFAWPGVGRVLVEAVQARDYPVVMAATTISAVLVVLGNLLADVAVTLADPRVRAHEARAAT